MDQLKQSYTEARINHWNQATPQKTDSKRIGASYQKLLQKYFRFLVPSGARILEIGCGNGDLLASLKPSFGVGVDFSSEMIKCAKEKHPQLEFIQADAHDQVLKEKFDIIVISDLVNDLWDAQQVFENLRPLCHPRTRIIINFYNNIWRLPLKAIRLLGLGADLMDQNWFTPHDVINLLQLSGFDVINYRPKILYPFLIRFISNFFNRILANLIPFKWFALTNFVVARPHPDTEAEEPDSQPSVSVVVAARNESGNIESIFKRFPGLGSKTELIFVEGHSSDNTYETILRVKEQYPAINCKVFQQTGKGKGDAVRLGFDNAEGDILMILDADLTVPPEDLYRFVDAMILGKGEFVNGVRLVYPMQDQAMRFFNILGNKFFSLVFSWLLEQPVKDTLCGTKVLWKTDYKHISENRNYFGEFDPFGDFDLLFGAAKLNLQIVEVPIRYRSRQYGDTNISRWRHGWLLLKMVVFAARRIKFI
jgi:SAM-dependent methyltransferase